MLGELEDVKHIIYVGCSETFVCITGVRNLILFSPLIGILIDNTVYTNNAHTIRKIFYILYVHLLICIINYSGVRNVEINSVSQKIRVHCVNLVILYLALTTPVHI